MPRRSSEAWWKKHWGQPCDLHDAQTVRIGGHRFRTDGRMVPAWKAFDRVVQRHGYDIHPPYPAGDSGMYNCRHIGGDPDRPWSVHAWAGAIDVNWQSNPDGSRLRTDMPKAMRDDLHALRTRSGAPVFRWGGDWDRDPRTGHSYYDAMHWEIVATPAEIATGILDPNEPPEEEDDMEAIVIAIYAHWRGDPDAAAKDYEGLLYWCDHGDKVGRRQMTCDLVGALAHEAGF